MHEIEGILARVQYKAKLNLLRTWNEIADTARSLTGTTDLSKSDENRLRQQIWSCISPKGGEITARYNTIDLGKIYLDLLEIGRMKFFNIMLEEFGIDNNRIKQITTELQQNPSIESTVNLTSALEPARKKVFRRFIALSNGLKFLVDVRADLMSMKVERPEFSALINDIRDILLPWFDVGLLDLHRITWDSPASLLEKLIAYEAVHKINSWDDLRNRLDSDRRCFAFFHYKIPNEPLIFVEVALTQNMVSNIAEILDESAPIVNPKDARFAIFYSISNTQRGLNGISLGNFLIKHVVDRLQYEFPNIKRFITLSPIPGFIKWLRSNKNLMAQNNILEEDLLMDTGADTLDKLQKPLMQMCALYLTTIKDPVAHFHLTNGAMIRKLNWYADTSLKGLKQSAGIMVNYEYELNKINKNCDNYTNNGEIVYSREIKSLL